MNRKSGLVARAVFPLMLSTLFLTPLWAVPADVETASLDIGRMERYLVAESEELRLEAYARIDTKEKLEAERQNLLREYRFMIGLDPLPPRTPLKAIRVRMVDWKEYTVEVLHYQSLPGFYVTANLYRPKKGRGPFPAVVWGPGHSSDPNGAKALRQNYAVPWVRAGYICLVIDPIQVAELFGVHRGTHSWQMNDWFSRGYSPISIEVWNAMRGVDYLLTRDDVDGDKLTVNGVSGGGHLSWMAGAADDRFTVVQPVAGTADIRAHIELDLQRRHCDCAYFINSYRHDWPTLAGIIAPRPLLILNSTEDGYYPVQGYQRVYERAKEIYGWYGVPDKVGLFEVPGPHAYTKEERERAVEFSHLQLLGKKVKIKERDFELIPGDKLSAFGGVYPEDNINARIQELLIPTAKLEEYRTLAQWEAKKAEILKNLKNVVFRNLPRPYKAVAPKKETAENQNGFIMETEAGIEVGMMSFFPPREPSEKKGALVYVASPGDTEDAVVWNFMRSYPFRQIPAEVHLVYPRGVGRSSWDWTTERKFERLAMLLGRTVDDMRLHDVLCAVDYAASRPSFNGELTLVGKGEAGILGAYAAVLDQRVTRVILHSPTLTHKEGPGFLNVLRYTDIPQALAAIAPREVVFLTDEMDHFDYTKRIYQLYNASDNFKRGYTVTQVMNVGKRVGE